MKRGLKWLTKKRKEASERIYERKRRRRKTAKKTPVSLPGFYCSKCSPRKAWGSAGWASTPGRAASYQDYAPTSVRNSTAKAYFPDIQADELPARQSCCLPLRVPTVRPLELTLENYNSQKTTPVIKAVRGPSALFWRYAELENEKYSEGGLQPWRLLWL